MKSIITTIVILIGVTTSIYAQGSVVQTAPNPMYVYNNGNYKMFFQPRTHNYGDYHEPVCDVNDYTIPGTHLFYLDPMSNISFVDNSVPGVPLHVFPLGNVVSSDNGPLTTIAQAQAYGKTQRWHCIKFEIGTLGAYVLYDITSLQSNAIPQYGPPLGPPYWGYWDKDPAGLIMDTQDVPGLYSSSVTNGTNSATWITLNNMEIIMAN